MARLLKFTRLQMRRALRSVVSLHGSPRDVALGAAIGVFVAFTPTVGFQMLIGAFLATLVGANRPAAIILPWITNPLTIPPIFALTYWVGGFFGAGRRPRRCTTNWGRSSAVWAGSAFMRFTSS